MRLLYQLIPLLCLIFVLYGTCNGIPFSDVENDFGQSLSVRGDENQYQRSGVLRYYRECGNCKGGKCVKKDGRDFCQCKPGQAWYFRTVAGWFISECRTCNCGRNSVDCIFGYSTPLDDDKRCTCASGYGDKKGTCTVCGCGGPKFNCTFSKFVFGGMNIKRCLCGEGYQEKNDKCEECDCGGPNFRCTLYERKTGGYEKSCSCGSKHIERNGKCIDPCSPNPCKNGGLCYIYDYKSHDCFCPAGFTGENCTKVDDPCASQPCYFGSKCVKGVGLNFTCECPSNATGKYCELEVDPCVSNPCLNGGTCHKVDVTEYVCACSYITTGKNCETVDPCLSDPCKNGGTCITSSVESYNCLCSEDYIGIMCEMKNKTVSLIL